MDPKKDYYRILDVSRTATPDEIKKVYHRLARRLHPDRNPGERALDRFKEINEAYAVLFDPEQRRQYDMMRTGINAPPRSASTQASPKSKGAGLFDFLKGRSGARPSDGTEGELTVSFEEAFRGGHKRVTVTVQQYDPKGKLKTERINCDVKVPPGIRHGEKIRLKANEGQTGIGQKDLIFRINLASHPIFKFEGEDLVGELRISPWEAALGQMIQAPGLEGPIEIGLPAGIGSGERIKLEGHGFPDRKKKARAPLYFRVMIDVPKQLTPPERTIFEQMRDSSRFNPRAKL